MDFSYYDSNNQIKKLDIKIGSKWSENKVDNEYLNSIFKSVDNGDNIVQEQEFCAVKFLLNETDSAIQNSVVDKVLENEELAKIAKKIKTEYSIEKLKTGSIEKIDPDDYTIERLKERYPEDKYLFLDLNEKIVIFDKKKNQCVLDISHYDDYSTTIIYSDDITRKYNQNGILQLESEPVTYPHDDFIKLLNNKDIANNKTELLKQVNLILERIDKSFINYTLSDFKEKTGKNLEEVIKKASIFKQNHYIREKILNHLNKCLEECYNYKHDFKNENSQVINKFHTGDSYTIDCKNEVMIITNNKTRKQKTLDLKKVVKALPLQQQVIVKKYLSELPGECLMDLSTEIGSFKNFQSTIQSRLLSRWYNASGGYQPMRDVIYLGGNDGYNADWSSDIVHELGHAIDFHGFIKVKHMSSRSDFKTAFKKGKKELLANGHTLYQRWSDNPFGDNDTYNRNNDGDIRLSNSNYATANAKEMFAECYNYLMLGTCNSADMLEDFFPDCLRIANEMIEEIRALSDDVRH